MVPSVYDLLMDLSCQSTFERKDDLVINEEALIPVQNGKIISNLETGNKHINDLKFEITDY